MVKKTNNRVMNLNNKRAGIEMTDLLIFITDAYKRISSIIINNQNLCKRVVF